MKDREIKFKVFCKKHNREEIYTLGDLICGQACTDNGEGGLFENWREYTGLKDKNGVEIYDGDIVKIDRVMDRKNVITDIYFGNQAFRYRHNDNSGSVLPNETKEIEGYERVTTNIEVIGNIYDNPDLVDKEV